MHSRNEEIEHAALILRRLLDADLLLAEDARPLLSGAEAVIELRGTGDEEAAQRLLEELASAGEALVVADEIDSSARQALVDAVRLLRRGSSE